MKAYIAAASAAALSVGLVVAAPTMADVFSFSTGNPDGKLGSLSQPPGPGLETETADDFVLTDATVISRATVHGLIASGLGVSDIKQVEVEVYHIFPIDSDTTRKPAVVTRVNSPADVEIGAATRDSGASPATLSFGTILVEKSFMVLNTVVNKINPAPAQFTGVRDLRPARRWRSTSPSPPRSCSRRVNISSAPKSRSLVASCTCRRRGQSCRPGPRFRRDLRIYKVGSATRS